MSEQDATAEKKANVKINSAPQGATIFLNGKSAPPLGVTPWSGRVEPGEYTVLLEAPGYEPDSRGFKVVEEGHLQELFAPLVKKPEP
jgi:hypothetical protein